jgi:hypothetical protein
MKATILIDFEEINGINPERPDLDKPMIMNSAKKLIEPICKGLEKELKSKKIKTKIFYSIEYGTA